MVSDITTVDLDAGDRVWSPVQMDRLPVGAMVCDRNDESSCWQKQADQKWKRVGFATGSSYESTQFSTDGALRVVDRAGDPPPPPPPDTLRQYQWKFRKNAIQGANENGIEPDRVQRGLHAMGVKDEWELGPGVAITSFDVNLVPDGTLVANLNHADPRDERFTLFVKRDQRFRPLLGQYGISTHLVIKEHPEVSQTPSWWAEVGDEKSAEEVAAWKARAWRIGFRIKRDNSWCGTYENVVARVGLTRKCLTAVRYSGFAPGDRVPMLDTPNLPVGSLLLFRALDDQTRWAIFRRDDDSNNAARTVRIAGNRGAAGRALGHYAHGGMVLLTVPTPGEDMTWDLPDGAAAVEMLSVLPVGTVFTYNGHDQFMICRDRRIANVASAGRGIPETGSYDPAVFRNYSVTIDRFEEQS